MSYTVKDKVYTEHPIMDEIVYNCKIILNNIVVKNDVYANSFETQESINNAEYYALITEGRMQFAYCPFTYQALAAYGCSPDDINKYLTNRENIPVEIRDDLVAFCSDYFMEHFEETNDYYRSFMGLPPYGSTQFNVYLTESNFPANYDTSTVDFSLPIHQQPINIISLLDSTGELERIRTSYPESFSYSYLRYLGDKSLDDYKMRKADKWEIMYMPFCEMLVKDRFIELYSYNRNIYLRRYYQEIFDVSNQHYENVMIINLLAQTFADMIVDVPEWYIRRDIFDMRSVQYFLESYGVAFFKEIPLKYQIRIVKNINKLIKYKSTNRNNQDILDIFGASETDIFKYYLYKRRAYDPATGEYVISDDPTKEYSLQFVKVKLGDHYDDYIRDESYIFDYDTMTLMDKWWDGEDDHETVKLNHLNRDFTIEGTKYMGLDYTVDLQDYLFQLEYFLGLVVDSRTNTNYTDMKIAIPSIQETTLFNISDLMILLTALSYSYDEMDCKVRRPEDNEEIEEGHTVPYEEIEDRESLLDWMRPRPKYADVFKNNIHMEYGFNPEADLDKIANDISQRHSAFQFSRGYTLEDLGVDTFIVPTDITSIPELIQIYKTNKKCHDTLASMMRETNDNYEYRVMKYVYDSLFTKKFDYELYKNNGTAMEYYTELLKKRDFVLYNLYLSLNSELNIETRKDNIRAIITDIVSTLEYYISDDGLNYIFAYTSSYTFQDVVRYIYLTISFFKSYKAYFIDPQVIYKTESSIDGTIRPRDEFREIKESDEHFDKLNTVDEISILETVFISDQALSGVVKEVVDIYSRFDPDPFDDYDYDGMYADTNLEYKQADGGHADPLSTIPYIMLNAGAAYGGRLDYWDLNGDGAEEHINEIIVDGGYPLDLEWLRNDHFGKDFTYIIDAGGASTNSFMTRTTRTRVVDRAITTDVMISGTKYNNITSKEDGLYLEDVWTDWQDFEVVAEDQKAFMEDISYRYENLSRKIELIDDPEMLDVWIEQSIEKVLAPMYTILSYEPDLSDVVREINEYSDDKADQLWDEFYAINPMTSWGTFF